MLKEEIREKIFAEAANEGRNLKESLKILSEVLVDYEVTRKWIFVYLFVFTKIYYNIDEKSIIVINECMNNLESNFEEVLLQNDKKYAHEDSYIEDKYNDIKRDMDELIHPKMEIDRSGLYRNVCNHKPNNEFLLNPIEIKGDIYLRCGICPPMMMSIDQHENHIKEMKKIVSLIDTINNLGVSISPSLQKEFDVIKELIEFSEENK